MLIKRLGIFLLVICLIFANAPVASCRSAPPIVYVSGNGSGDFNCDGKDDHVQINQALKFVASNPKYTTVHLKGPFTYVIDDTLLIGSNTILQGDSTAVIKLANNAGWKSMKPLIQQMNSAGNSNIVVRGFEIDANHDGNLKVAKGKGYYNIMYFTHCNNIKVYNMYMHDGHGDGVRIKYGKNIQLYNNKISKLGHDGFFLSECENAEVWNNKIVCRTNSGVRIWNSNKVKIHNNEIDSLYYRPIGGPGIQIEKGGTGSGTMDQIEIYENIVHDTYGPGIWLFNYDTSPATKEKGKNVHIHHNIFYNTGTNTGITWTGGIVASGFHDTLIENNVFDGAYHAPGYTTIVRNNIIVNTRQRIKSPSGTGYAVANYLTKNHKFVLENNCLYGNSGGNYKNCASKSDIYVNPLFADQKKHDYHLQSTAGRWNGKTWVKDKVTSPCIDAGYPLSDYTNEPEDNGDRINIGRYGNTIYASLSPASRVKTVQSPLMEVIPEDANEVEEYPYIAMETFDTDRSNFRYSETGPFFDTGQGPVIESIPETVVKIGENLNFTLKASGTNGDNLIFSSPDLPEGADLDETGFFSWTPEEGQEGVHIIPFEASDGLFSDSKVAVITVEEANEEEITGEANEEEIIEETNEEKITGKTDGEEITGKANKEEIIEEETNKEKITEEKTTDKINEEVNKEVNKGEIEEKENEEAVPLNISGTIYETIFTEFLLKD